MEEKNKIINNYARSILAAAESLCDTSQILNDKEEENVATVKTLNVQLETMRSLIVLCQQELDKYK